MSTYVTVPGFESSDGWAFFAPRADRVTFDPYEGTYHARLIGGKSGGTVVCTDTMPAGKLVKVSFRAKALFGLAVHDLDVRLEDGGPGGLLSNGVRCEPVSGQVKYDVGNPYDTVAYGPVLDFFNAYQLVEWFFYAPVQATPLLTLTVPSYAPDSDSYWYVDNVQVEDAMLTNALRTALVQDLEDIDGTGIFQTTVAEVGTAPRSLESMRTPGIYLAPNSSGTATPDEDTMGERRGIAEQTYALQLVVRDPDPLTAIEKLLDDVKNAVDRPSAALEAALGAYGGASVRHHRVTEWTDTTTAEDIANRIARMDVTVSIEFGHTLGGA